jgi:hypothetical protein
MSTRYATMTASLTGAVRRFAPWGFLICASAFGLSELTLPDEIHNTVEQPAGAALVLLSVLYVVKLRRSASGKRRRERAEEELARGEEWLELAQSVRASACGTSTSRPAR